LEIIRISRVLEDGNVTADEHTGASREELEVRQ
jgi:hypothetical protein